MKSFVTKVDKPSKPETVKVKAANEHVRRGSSRGLGWEARNEALQGLLKEMEPLKAGRSLGALLKTCGAVLDKTELTQVLTVCKFWILDIEHELRLRGQESDQVIFTNLAAIIQEEIDKL